MARRFLERIRIQGLQCILLLSLVAATSSQSAASSCRPINHILDSLPRQCPTSLHTRNRTISSTEAQNSSPISQATQPPLSNDTNPEQAGNFNLSFGLNASNTSQDDAPSSSFSTFLQETTSIIELPSHTPESSNTETEEIDDTARTEDVFLSFEDWKRMNLQKSIEEASEHAEEIIPVEAREAPQPRGRSPDQALDTIGDELELEVSGTYGKTSKERFNYASFDCAAAVLKANPEAKGSSSILDENRDRYMLNKCGASNKFVIVELCEDILVDTVVLANFEYFSSTFKEIRISVTDRYPVPERGWKALGTFVGNNTRSIQVFAVENPLIWARYLRIEFLSHYGTEFYCPLTLLRVHGTTMMEEYKNQENSKLEGQRQVVGIASTVQAEEIETQLEKSTNESSEQSSTTSIDSAPVTLSEVLTTSCDSSTPGTTVCSVETLQKETVVPSSEIISSLHASEPETSISGQAPSKSDVSTVSSQSSTSSSSTISTSTSTDAESQSDKSMSSTQSINRTESSSATSTSIPPVTQDSVYKTITKRLSLLEANATLSLRYIEEQSQFLRDVFNRMERRHSQKIDSFLSDLNSTIITRLQFFKEQYEQLWQSTIVELEFQRDLNREQMIAVTSRLSLLADELLFQKRMSIAHSVMLLVTLLLVLTTRGVNLDFGIVPRQGTRRDIPIPDDSPNARRPQSTASPWQTKVEAIMNTQSDFVKRRRSLHSPNIRESVQSAPATPSGAQRAWTSPRPSSLGRRHHYTSEDEDTDTHEVIYDDAQPEIWDDRPQSQNSINPIYRNGTVQIMEPQDYPTPTPSNEDYLSNMSD